MNPQYRESHKTGLYNQVHQNSVLDQEFLQEKCSDNFEKYKDQDIFDFGFTLLICMLDPLHHLYNNTNFLTIETLHQLIEIIHSKKTLAKDICCVLHSEEKLRKIASNINICYPKNLSLTILRAPLTNNFHFSSPRQLSKTLNINTSSYEIKPTISILKEQNRYSESCLDLVV